MAATNPRIPPHDEAAERSVLGSILTDVEAISRVADLLDPDSFYIEANQCIFLAMQSLYENRSAIDVVTVCNQLKKQKELTKAGGTSGVAALAAEIATAANVVHYAKLVHENSVKRRLISMAAEVHELAFDQSKEVGDIMDIAEQRVFTLSQKQQGQAFVPLRDTLVESFERLDELQKGGSELRGVPTGFADLDSLLAGMQRSNLLILAARPGMGKTSFAMNIAQSVVVSNKLRVGFFSLEMSREELVDRLLVAQADIDAWRLKTGRLDQQEYHKLSDAMGVLADAQLYIDDTPGLSIYEMRTRARRLMSEFQINLLIVDYLQLARGRTKDNRVQEVAEISQGLKNIARELKIPVLALSQLSRAIESRGEKIPQLSDLRESGSIEQDADVVMFLYRKDDDIREAVNLKIAKHRNGAVGDIPLFFRGDRVKFYGMEQHRGNQ